MKVILEAQDKNEEKQLLKILKSFSGRKIPLRRSIRPMESLISFAEKNAVEVKKIIIPSRDERNER